MDLRELARLDQINQHVPLVLLEHGEVARFADPHFITGDLDIGARASSGRA